MSARAVIVKRIVEAPLTNEGLMEAARSGESSIRVTEEVEIDLVLLIGAFARIEGRSEAQTLAARQYRHLYECAQIGGAKATDYTQAKVDVSGVSAVGDLGIDARAAYSAAVKRLGLISSGLIERVVCEDRSIRELCRLFGDGEGGAARTRFTRRLFGAVDVLVDHFGYEPKGRRQVRRWGEVPSERDSTPVVVEHRTAPEAA